MEKKPTLLQHTLIYGAILGIVSIIISLVMYIAGYMPVNIKSTILTGLISIAISIIFVSYGIKSYRDKVLDGSISYGQAFVVGLLIIVFSALLGGIYNLIFTNVIDPEYMDRVLEATKNSTYDMMSNMGATDAQIEDSMDKFDERIAKMTPMRTFMQGFIWSVIFGTIISLIVAAFTRKSKNPVA
ncbi:MAG TPA: DUF4199 domain-containing protein [Bacteroidales bacterium]|jgi:hypothetical protein|nr:DUF4199 domain-containing protein [Bacteroidales bacterium]